MSFLATLLFTILLLNNEHPTYNVVQTYDNMEVRLYYSYIVAETVVQADFEQAGNEAFHILAGYIFGKNDKGLKIAMTSPVTQQEIGPNKYLIQFMMPSEWTLQTLPKPTDSRINLRKLLPRKLAAVRYHGGWRESKYLNNLNSLEIDVKRTGLNQIGKPIWARYNSPMTPELLRTNEVLVEVQ